MAESSENKSWLNRTVLGVGLTSLFSDWSHETATAVLLMVVCLIGTTAAGLDYSTAGEQPADPSGKPEGGKKLSATEFANQTSLSVGTLLGI